MWIGEVCIGVLGIITFRDIEYFGKLLGFFQQFWEKAPGQTYVEHNKGSKIYPQNQVLLD